MSDSLFAALDLTPESRWPLKLRQSSVEAVLTRPVTCLLNPASSPGSDDSDKSVSIVVVSYNNLFFNRLCLESILVNTSLRNYELIVVDNGSEDGTVEYLLELARLNKPVRLLLNDQNRGFAMACNQGLSVARGEILVILNNDTIVPARWLHGLLRRLEDPGVGLVGPVTNRCGNEAQIETSYVTYDQFLDFAHTRARQHGGEDQEIRMLTMFCVALRKDTFVQIGPLDERFEVGLFEDEDYSMRVCEAGYRLVCTEDVFVHHFGQASIGNLAVDDQFGELFRRNRHKFEEKWNCRWRPHGRRPNPEYRALVTRIRLIVKSSIPAEAIVVIASKGDEDLLTLPGCRAWHFPQGENGLYTGFHPADSKAAIWHLNQLRKDGAAFLLLPAPMFWWLQYYSGFAQHLAESYPCTRHDDTCLIYQLSELQATDSGPGVRLCKRARGLDRLNRNLVTLILPVDDDYDRIGEILTVLLRYGQHPHRLLLITHSSHDESTMSLLGDYVDRYDHIALAETGRSRDVIAAINIGCKLAPGDVVVLHGSFEFTDHWLEKLGARARSQGVIATVSPAGCMPLSDSTLPASPAESTTPIGQTPFPTRRPMPVRNAYCLYITRAAIRRVGLFDERQFSNFSAALQDFQVRATSLGFVHLVDDATCFSHGDSHLSFRQVENVKSSERTVGQPCVLALVHSGSGGTRFATEDLMLAISENNRCLLLRADISEWLLYEVLDNKLKLSLRFGFAEPWRLETAPGKHRLAVMRDICESFDVGLVNIHHLLCSGPEVMELFAQLDVPVIFSFHDYYSICPTAHLIDNHGRNCGGTCTAGVGECSLSRTFFHDRLPVLKHGYVHEHRKRMEKALLQCRAFTAPSFVSMSVLRQSLTSLRQKDFHIIEHGRDLIRKQLAVEPEQGKPVRLICLGNMNEAKGVNLVRELMALNLDQGFRFEFHFLGGHSREFRPEDMGGIHHGAYDRGEYLDRLVRIGPSFSLCASICDETHSYTLTESWAAGLPVFASGLGALRERIEIHGGGWLFDPGNANTYFDGMTEIIDTPGAWRKEVTVVNAIRLRTVAEEAAAMLNIFRQSFNCKDKPPMLN